MAQRNLLEGSSKRSRSDPKHTEPPIPDTPRCLPAVAACRPRGGAVCSRRQQKLTSRLHLNAARTAEMKEEVVQQHRAGSAGLVVHAGSGCACVHCPMAASVDACPPAAGGVPQTPRAADPTSALLFASFKPSRAEPQHPNDTLSPRSDTPGCYLTRGGWRAPRSAGPAPRPGRILSRSGWMAAQTRRSGARACGSSHGFLADPASRPAAVGRDVDPDRFHEQGRT